MGEAPDPDLRDSGPGSGCLRYLNERQLRFFIFAQAASWSGAAVAAIIGVLLEAEIDMLIIGFRASLTLSCVMALFHRRKKTPWVGLIGFPKL